MVYLVWVRRLRWKGSRSHPGVVEVQPEVAAGGTGDPAVGGVVAAVQHPAVVADRHEVVEAVPDRHPRRRAAVPLKVQAVGLHLHRLGVLHATIIS